MKKRIFKALAAAVLIIIFCGGAFVYNESTYVLPVLMYHSIDYNDRITKLSVSPESFEAQMEFLHKKRYNVLTLKEAIAFIMKKKRVPPKTLVITFDDGYYNNYAYAYPVLKKYKIPATIFVITSKMGEPGFINRKQLREMSDSGLITIGSHTVNHLWLPDISPKDLRYEVAESRRILEETLGKGVDTFCYPIGAFDENVKKTVEESGYICAVTTNPGWFKRTDDIFAIKRIKITRSSDNLFIFWAKTTGLYTWYKERRGNE